MPLDISDLQRRGYLLSYFWARVREENWCGWYTPVDPQYEWCIRFGDPSPVPSMYWFEGSS